jgi:hypothetical protein
MTPGKILGTNDTASFVSPHDYFVASADNGSIDYLLALAAVPTFHPASLQKLVAIMNRDALN